MPPCIEPSDLAGRCQIHSAKMDEEGHYVTANVLFLAANEIELLRDMLRRAMEHGLNGNRMYHALKAGDLGGEIAAYLKESTHGN